MKLTVADIKRCFWLDDTGTVRWKASVEPVDSKHAHWFRGTIAGALTKPRSGVQYRHIKYTSQGSKHMVLAQVVAFTLHNGKFPDGQVDHLDGDGLNNAGSNLRDVNQRVNMCNAKLYTSNVSGVKGVTPDTRYPNMWRASAKVNGKQHNLYYGDDFFLAVCARKSFEAKHDYLDSAYSTQNNLKG